MWPADTAREAHGGRRPYAAVISTGAVPSVFVEFNDSYVGVGFLDRQLREELMYQFQERSPGRLFLTMAVHRDFEGSSDRVVKGSSYSFNEDGRVTIEDEDFVGGKVAKSERKANVRGNWEQYPAFGDYGSITRREREAG